MIISYAHLHLISSRINLISPSQHPGLGLNTRNHQKNSSAIPELWAASRLRPFLGDRLKGLEPEQFWVVEAWNQGEAQMKNMFLIVFWDLFKEIIVPKKTNGSCRNSSKFEFVYIYIVNPLVLALLGRKSGRQAAVAGHIPGGRSMWTPAWMIIPGKWLVSNHA